MTSAFLTARQADVGPSMVKSRGDKRGAGIAASKESQGEDRAPAADDQAHQDARRQLELALASALSPVSPYRKAG